MLVSWCPEQNSGDESICVKQHRTRKWGKGRKGGNAEGQLLEMTRKESQEVWLLDGSLF